jgi:hypothetical protein
MEDPNEYCVVENAHISEDGPHEVPDPATKILRQQIEILRKEIKEANDSAEILKKNLATVKSDNERLKEENQRFFDDGKVEERQWADAYATLQSQVGHNSSHHNQRHHSSRHHQQAYQPDSAVVQLLQEMKAPDVDTAVKNWNSAQDELRRLTITAKKLQEAQLESLSFVDRFQPAMDRDLENLFKRVNSAIGSLVRDKEFLSFAQEDFLRVWVPAGVFFPGSIHPKLLGDSRYITESKKSRVYIKLLLYQAVWKFLDEKLFDSCKPFAAYSNSFQVDNYVHNAFTYLFYPGGRSLHPLLSPVIYS